MSIDAVTGTVSAQQAAAAAAASKTAESKQSMDSDVFMHLLVTQLQNQDPSSPMDTNEMLAQTTQLAMMEKMTELTTTSTENFSLQMRIAASAIIGQNVSYLGADGKLVSGKADSVSFKNAVPTVSIDGKDIALDLISGISTAAAAPVPVPATS